MDKMDYMDKIFARKMGAEPPHFALSVFPVSSVRDSCAEGASTKPAQRAQNPQSTQFIIIFYLSAKIDTQDMI